MFNNIINCITCSDISLVPWKSFLMSPLTLSNPKQEKHHKGPQFCTCTLRCLSWWTFIVETRGPVMIIHTTTDSEAMQYLIKKQCNIWFRSNVTTRTTEPTMWMIFTDSTNHRVGHKDDKTPSVKCLLDLRLLFQYGFPIKLKLHTLVYNSGDSTPWEECHSKLAENRTVANTATLSL